MDKNISKHKTKNGGKPILKCKDYSLLIIIFIFIFKINIFANSLETISTKETLIKTFEIDGDVNYEELIPNKIEHKEEFFIKTNVKLVDEKFRTENIDIVEPAEKIISEKEKNNAISLFEKEIEYKKENYNGTLKLDESSLKLVKNEVENITTYDTKKYTLYEDKTYYGLEENDYSLLPQTIIKDGIVLKLITADFIKTNSKDTYNAICKYGGAYQKKIPSTKQLVKTYKVTVNYKGSVSKKIIEKRIVDVAYEKITENKVIELDTETISEDTEINTEELSLKEIDTNALENTNKVNEIDKAYNNSTNNNQIFILAIIVIFLLSIIIIVVVIAFKPKQKQSNNKFERRNKFEKKFRKKKRKYKDFEDEEE